MSAIVEIYSLSELPLHPELRHIFGADTAPVVIYPVSHAVGLSVIRTLESENIPLLAVDHKPKAAGLRSNRVTPLLMPSLGNDVESFCHGMLAIGKCFKVKPVLFVVDDEELFATLKLKAEFADVFHLPLSDWSIVEPIVDKGIMYRRLQSVGYPIPASFFPQNIAELDAMHEQLPLPCIIKPTYSTEFRLRFGVKAKYFADFTSLRRFAQELYAIQMDFVIQEFIPGGAERLYTFGAFSDDSGQVLAAFTGRKLHQFPPDFGTCRLGESVRSPELEAVGSELLKILRYRGISLTEFKLDDQGKFRLIELNPRPGDWPERLAQLCGSNLVLAAYKYAIGQAIIPTRISRFGVKWVNTLEDFYYCVRGYRLFGYPEAHRGLLGWLWDLRRVESCAFFSWRDPLPGIVRTLGMIGEFAARERSQEKRS